MSKPGKNQHWENFPAGAVARNPSAKAGDAGLPHAPEQTGPWAPLPSPRAQSLVAARREAAAPPRRAAPPPQGEKAPRSSEGPAQPKTKDEAKG